jgi:hypothetical protein
MRESMDKMRIEMTKEINTKIQDKIDFRIDRLEIFLRDKESSTHTNPPNTTPQKPSSSSTTTTTTPQPGPPSATNMQPSMFPNGLPIVNVNQPPSYLSQPMFRYPMI